MCIATAGAAEPLKVQPAPTAQTQPARPNEPGVKWKLGKSGRLDDVPTEIHRVSTNEIRKIAATYGVRADSRQLGFTVLRGSKDNGFRADIYVVAGRDEAATLAHEKWHAAGYVHD
jgi:hypothetical protein